MDDFRKIKYRKWKKKQKYKNKQKLKNAGELRCDRLLSEDIYKYFERVNLRLEENFETKEDQKVFIENVLIETRNLEHDLVQDSLVCPILERLINLGTEENIVYFMKKLENDIIAACEHTVTSHFIQTLLLQVLRFLSESDKTDEKIVGVNKISKNNEIRQTLIDLTLNYSHVICDHLDEFMCHVHACYIVRTIIQVLSGCKIIDKKPDSRHIPKTLINKDVIQTARQPLQIVPVPKKFFKSLEKLIEKIEGMQNVNELIFNNVAVPVFQILLIVLKRTNAKWCERIISFFLERSDILNQNDIFSLLGNTHTSYFMEILSEVSSDDQFSSLFDNVFKEKIVDMALHPIANFVLQKIILSCRTQEQVNCIFDILNDHLEDILSHNNSHVLVKLAEACLCHKTRQQDFIKALKKVFHCFKEQKVKIAPLIASLCTYETMFEKANKIDITLAGSLILQHLFNFESPTLIVKSIVNLSSDDLYNWSTNVFGSRILEAFFKGPFVGTKAKSMILQKITNYLVDIACSVYGSRFLNTLWEELSLKDRSFVANTFAARSAKLNSDRFGKFVYQKCGLFYYNKRHNDWVQVQQSQIKKRKLFDEFVDII